MSHPRRLCLLLLTACAALLAAPVQARAPALIWEKMHVFHALPSVVFARLGLTHSTRNGYTRDGKRGIPDPGFPPGLTDVVPSDAERLLLVRGTAGGLSLFHSRVAAADVQIPSLHLNVQLTRREDPEGTPPLEQEMDNVQDSVPVQVALGEGEASWVYQIKTHANSDGSLWVACRVSLPLPPPPASGAEGPSPAAVFIPDRVWTDPASRKIRLGETAIFNDLAADRLAASRKLKLGETVTNIGDNYTLRVTLTPEKAAAMPDPATQP